MPYTYDCGCADGYDCGCQDYPSMGLGSMGATPPGAVPVTGSGGILSSIEGAITTTIKNIINGSLLGFGSGRTEADLIVPVQNAMTARLAEIVAAYPSANPSTLQALYNELKSMKSTFINFVNDPRFKDGRASHNALYGDGTTPGDKGMIFYFDDNLGKIAARIQQLGGAAPDPTLPFPYTMATAGVGSLSTTTLLMLGVGALLLYKGKIL